MSRPWLGLVTQALTPELARAWRSKTSTGLLFGVIPASPGTAAGMHPGDLVMMLDARRLVARVDLRARPRRLEQAGR